MLSLVTDRTQQDVDLETEKGVYTHVDLNRVGNAMAYLRKQLNLNGYSVNIDPYTEWPENYIPSPDELAYYLECVKLLRDSLTVSSNTPECPNSIDYLGYIEANNIEKILIDIENLLESLRKIFLRSGVTWAVSSGPNYNFLDYTVSSLLDANGINLVSSNGFYLTADYSYQYKSPVITWRTLITKDKMYLISSDELRLEAKTIG